ncbi:MAG: cell division protein FtsK, partial [Glaciihabitans sp.]|nr:cell division protein FtsK [Glaciihabitans sp.]
MATTTRTNSRARAGSTSGARTTSNRTRNAPTKRLPAARAVPEQQPGILSKAWMGLAHIAGGAFRVLGKETLAKDERRDGVPFFVFLLAVAGAVVEWFNPADPVALALHTWTFGGLFGHVAFALPVIMLLFAVWLFRHPASVHDNTRIGIGVTLLVSMIAAISHLATGKPPQPSDGIDHLAQAGGVVGWLVAAPLTSLGSAVLAWPVVIVLLVLSLFIITKTPPNKVGFRLHELYAYLFGAQLPEPAAKEAGASDETEPLAFGTLSDLGLDDADPASMPWWRRGKARRDGEAAFDSPVVGR